MKNKDLIPGRDIFGSDAEKGWETYDLYDQATAEFVRLQIESGDLLEGGPELDLQELERLRDKRESDERADEIICTLCKYQNHARYLHAMNVRDNPAEIGLDENET